MARPQPYRRFTNRSQRRPAPTAETTLQTAGRYGLIAVASGLGVAFGANALEAAQERQAILDALPAGYTYSGCSEVRAAGVAPLYRHEPGFSERLDGDGDGIGCEPYRGR
ncbi:excalibur calcium-binding domain-containing protein [Sphingosinicella microcystinivorans]|uniref:excalibur calcium-binding domain-containing protein n=1 Tax=Sphingosinicella microcystinivorans TaxID=335406 RepID=UPI000EB14C63|nr:excalibur calcium-binding domain-containing protein [Sphingosinicella microcystinivorans]